MAVTISSLKWLKEPIGSFKVLAGIDASWGVSIKNISPLYSTSGVKRFMVSFLKLSSFPRGTTILVAISEITGF
jgi:hypothetical protein